MRYVLILVFAALPTTAFAQARWPVFFVHSGEDQVGQEVAYELRNELSASPRFVMAQDRSNAQIGLFVLSLDANDAQKGWSSALAVTVILSPGSTKTFVNTWVVMVGRFTTKQMAKSILSSMDAELERLKLRGSL